MEKTKAIEEKLPKALVERVKVLERALYDLRILMWIIIWHAPNHEVRISELDFLAWDSEKSTVDYHDDAVTEDLVLTARL